MKLDIHIDEVHVANDLHKGAMRIGFDHYVGQGAQKHLDALAAANKDVDTVVLLPEQQQIVVVMAKPYRSEAGLKRAANGFILAIQEWYEQLDDLDRHLFGLKPNHAQTARESISSTGLYITEEV